MNFLGAIQPIKTLKDSTYEAMPRVCGRGICAGHDDAKEQLIALYKREHPKLAKFLVDPKSVSGGIFVFECTPYELMEKAADEESTEIIRRIYEDAIELAPLEI